MEDFSCLIAFITDEYLWKEIVTKISRDLDAWVKIPFQDVLSCITEVEIPLKSAGSFQTSYWNIELGIDECYTPLLLAIRQENVRHVNFVKSRGWYTENACMLAARYGRLVCLRELHANGYIWNENTCCNAVENDNIECLKYLHEHGCPWDTTLNTNIILELPEDELSKYWSDNICTCAAMCGAIKCLKYVHECGCPWNWETCAGAAHGNSLICLKYAHENGCPWNVVTYLRATDSPECLAYARANGCPQW